MVYLYHRKERFSFQNDYDNSFIDSYKILQLVLDLNIQKNNRCLFYMW